MQMNVGYSERRNLTSVLELRGGVKESWHGVEQRPVRRRKGTRGLPLFRSGAEWAKGGSHEHSTQDGRGAARAALEVIEVVKRGRLDVEEGSCAVVIIH